MKEITALVERGQVRLPDSVRLPDGTQVRISWDETAEESGFIEREPLTEEDVLADIRWATGTRFPNDRRR